MNPPSHTGPSAPAGFVPADVLVVDDEVPIRRLLRVTLEGAGYKVREAANGQLGLHECALRPPDLLILDLGLPDGDGSEIVRRLREWSRLPVLILSVRDREEDKISALDSGADDYITKPFAGGELLARVRALLRRGGTTNELSVVAFGDIEVDLAVRVVRKAGAEIHLTAREYALLRLLVRHLGRVVTHRHILRELWGPNAEEFTHYLRVHMTHLRQKLETDPARPRHLKTESGLGYRLVE